MVLVPQESTLTSNRTLDPSVSFGPHVGSSRVILSGCTAGQVEVRVVTTVIVPSAEQTEIAQSGTVRGGGGGDLPREESGGGERVDDSLHHVQLLPPILNSGSTRLDRVRTLTLRFSVLA